MKQKVTERRLAVGGLEEEVEYRFSVRAVTEGAGAGASSSMRVRTGPQAGSPAAPRALQLQPEPAALRLRWLNAAPGDGPLKGYYFEARRKGASLCGHDCFILTRISLCRVYLTTETLQT